MTPLKKKKYKMTREKYFPSENELREGKKSYKPET